VDGGARHLTVGPFSQKGGQKQVTSCTGHNLMIDSFPICCPLSK
jgi:hypothetical protein